MNASPYATLMRIPMRTMSRQTRYALEGVDDILVYKVAMTTRFRGVTRREGLLLHGHAGWGEAAPFWNYDDVESSRWLAAALESTRRFPPGAFTSSDASTTPTWPARTRAPESSPSPRSGRASACPSSRPWRTERPA